MVLRNTSMPLNFYLQPHIQQIIKKLNKARAQHKVVVLASGVFDLFHHEHANYLRAAKKTGDILVVAIESNARTRELKGENRPVHDEKKRLATVLGIPEVDYAFILPKDFNTQKAYEELLIQLKPDLYAVSSHSDYQENKRALMEKHGGKLVVVHKYNPHISTTKILQG